MSIYLKQMDQIGLNQDFQIKVLEQDRTRDGQLDRDDFESRFGKKAAEAYYPEVESSIQRNDPKSFSEALQKMEKASRQKFSQAFCRNVSAMRMEFEKLGVRFQRNEIDISGVSEEKLKSAEALMADVVINAYTAEYEQLPEGAEILIPGACHLRMGSGKCINVLH